jgi:hypothetical protein
MYTVSEGKTAMNYQQTSNEQLRRNRSCGERRTVVLDIETVSLDAADERGALDAMTGRVVCVAMLIDDGEAVTELIFAGENEQLVLAEFWGAIKANDLVVGHNVLDFDLAFLRQRSWILGIQPSRTFDVRRYYTLDVIDTLQLWTNWTGNKKGVTLGALGSVLGCGGKTGAGANVAEWWAKRDVESIKRYCQDDVRLTYRVFCRLTYQQPKETALEGDKVSVEESTANKVAEVSLT